MKINIKVAGTTFHPLPEGVHLSILSEGTLDNVPCAFAQALLVPEPENEYDKDAVAVYGRLMDGKPFHLGYIPKAEPLKFKIRRPMPARMLIKDYGQVGRGLSPSFVLVELEGEV